jgi:hypothetical protein
MDDILVHHSTDVTPSVATSTVAPHQQQRARRKSAMSPAAFVAIAVREDLMLVPEADDRNGNSNVDGRSLVLPPADANTGELPSTTVANVAQSLDGSPPSPTSTPPTSSCSSSAVVVQKDLNKGHHHPTCGGGGSDAGSGYGSSSSGEKLNDNNKNGRNSKKKTALSTHAVEYLKNWMMSPEHVDHPYPTEDEKLRIMSETGIVLKQLTNWFVNNRKRYWKPKVEELRRRQGGDTGSSLEITEVAADQGGGGVTATTITKSMTTGKTNADDKDEGGKGGGLGEESSQSRREEDNRKPPPFSHSSGCSGKRRNKRHAPAASDDDETTFATTSSIDTSTRRAKKARGEVAKYPVIVDPIMQKTTALALTSTGVATDVSHESVKAQSRKLIRVNANGSCTSVVSDESAEEGGGARGGGSGTGASGTEEESGDDIDQIRNVAVSNPLLVETARAIATAPDSRVFPPSLNVIGSNSGAIRANHQQVMMMIDMEYSINPLDMDDSNDDLIQNNMAVDRTICCSSVLPHSCSDSKV